MFFGQLNSTGGNVKKLIQNTEQVQEICGSKHAKQLYVNKSEQHIKMQCVKNPSDK